jgi:hypothetical protein
MQYIAPEKKGMILSFSSAICMVYSRCLPPDHGLALSILHGCVSTIEGDRRVKWCGGQESWDGTPALLLYAGRSGATPHSLALLMASPQASSPECSPPWPTSSPRLVLMLSEGRLRGSPSSCPGPSPTLAFSVPSLRLMLRRAGRGRSKGSGWSDASQPARWAMEATWSSP